MGTTIDMLIVQLTNYTNLTRKSKYTGLKENVTLSRRQSKGQLFDRWLRDTTQSEFQDFIDDAPKELHEWPLDLLQECLAVVEARLKAEPDQKIFSMSNPHDVRVHYWSQIAGRLKAEIDFRLGPSTNDKTSVDSARQKRIDPDIAKRRAVVARNRNKSAKDLCALFDYHDVPLPMSYEPAQSWREAYLDQKFRHAIQTLITRDKSNTQA